MLQLFLIVIKLWVAQDTIKEKNGLVEEHVCGKARAY
jgi:hypothetical protein